MPEETVLRTVSASALNIRMAPSSSSERIGRLPRGTVVEVLDQDRTVPFARLRAQLRDGTVEGWAATRYLLPVHQPAVAVIDRSWVSEGLAEPPWLTVAREELNACEYPGPDTNPRISIYFSTTTHAAGSDEVPWCSAFVNYCLQQAGYQGTNSAGARSWEDWGKGLETPEPGCIVVFWRVSRNDWRGHVGFYLGEEGDDLLILGGNQSNCVKVSPQALDHVLAYRWPTTRIN